MAQLTDINLLYDQMLGNNLSYWIVKDLQDHPLAFNNSELPIKESVGKLKEVLNNMEGTVMIVLKDKPNKSVSRGGNLGATVIHTINLDKAFGVRNAPAIGSPGMGIGADEVQSMILRERASWEKEQEIKELKAQVEELQSGGMWGSLLEKFSPIINHFAMGAMPRAKEPVISGDNAAPDIKENAAQEQMAIELDEALNSLMNSDPDFIKTLQALAWYAKQHPDMYNNAKGMITSQYKAAQ